MNLLIRVFLWSSVKWVQFKCALITDQNLVIISRLAHYIFKLLRGIQAWAPSPSDNSPRAGRLGINEVAATIGGGGGQIKPLVGGGCWRTWQSGTQQTERITGICVSRLQLHRFYPDFSFAVCACCPELTPSQKQHEVQEVMCGSCDVCVLWQLPARTSSHKLRLLLSDPCPLRLMSHFQ